MTHAHLEMAAFVHPEPQPVDDIDYRALADKVRKQSPAPHQGMPSDEYVRAWTTFVLANALEAMASREPLSKAAA